MTLPIMHRQVAENVLSARSPVARYLIDYLDKTVSILSQDYSIPIDLLR